MIWSSETLADMAFKFKIFESERLNSSVSHTNGSDGHFETPSWRRVIEGHSWGVVIYLSDRKLNRHATVVIRGMFEPKTGNVKDNGAVESIIDHVPWYTGIIEAEKEGQLWMKIEIPECIGYHAPSGDPDSIVCDGGLDSKTGLKEPACTFRDRCIRFQLWCAAQNVEPIVIKTGKSKRELLEVLQSLPKQELPALPADGEDSQEESPSGQNFSMPQGLSFGSEETRTDLLPSLVRLESEHPPPVTGRVLDARRNVLTSTATKIFQAIATVTGRTLVASRAAARAGDLFILDRRAESNYVSLYCETTRARGAKIPVLRLHLHAALIALDALLPTEEDHLAFRSCLGKLTSYKKSGRFRTSMRIAQNADIPFLVEVTKALIDSGTIQLPLKNSAK